MTFVAATKIASQISTRTVARIDAQDEDFIFPLRDFLISFGCEVIVNRPLSVPSEYHIICGDTQYVKQIFPSFSHDATRRLVIVTDGDDENAKKISHGAKVVLVDFSSFTAETVTAVFQFLFTSEASLLDIRKNPKKHVAAHQSDLPKHAPHVKETPTQTDAERINSIVTSIFSPSKPTTSGKKKWKRPSVWALIPFFVLLPFFWYSVSLMLATATVAFGASLLRSGNVETAAQTMPLARFWINQSTRVLRFVGQPVTLVNEEVVYGQERYISLIGSLASSILGVSNVFLTGKTLGGELMTLVGESGQITSPAREVEKLRTELFSVQNNLGLAESELHELVARSSFPFWFAGTKRLGEKGEKAIAAYRQTISYVDKFLLLYPRIAGFKQKQVYLVLLQNSMELRPTGGFIGSVAVISAEEGRITDLVVRDVYELDGQLKGHVDPPTPIREILGQEHWYLRDSNWEPDFHDSGQRAAWFYEKETGTRVDGVIGVSTPFVVDLLSVTGPLTLSDYNDRITSQNFYGKSLFYTQSDFFPGSTQKKDFLGSLTRALISELRSSKNLHPVNLFRVITNGLDRHNLMVYFSDPEFDNVVAQFGWSGQVYTTSGCEGVSGTCLFDPLMVVEANLGVNKANYFIGRRLARAITIAQDGHVTEKTQLFLENTSAGQPHDSGGVYRLYVRYFLSSDATVTGIDINGAPISFRDIKAKTPPSIPYAEYDQTTGTLGVAIDVTPGSTSQLSVDHERGTALQFAHGKATYEVFVQKQAGTVDSPLTLTLDYPQFWEAQSQEAFLAKGGHLEYNTTLSQDSLIRFQFSK